MNIDEHYITLLIIITKASASFCNILQHVSIWHDIHWHPKPAVVSQGAGSQKPGHAPGRNYFGWDSWGMLTLLTPTPIHVEWESSRDSNGERFIADGYSHFFLSPSATRCWKVAKQNKAYKTHTKHNKAQQSRRKHSTRYIHHWSFCS